jgi:cell division septation protein DedD
MRGVFNDEEFEPAAPRREAEFTLGSKTLLAVFLGLVLICGLCFGLGYAIGRRSSHPPTAAELPPPGEPTDLQPDDNSQPKPSPNAQGTHATAPQDSAANPSDSADTDTNSGADAQNSNPAAETGSSYSQPQVRPALPSGATPPKAMQPGTAPKAASAAARPGPFMVQVAAVAHQEDAAVLVSALRKHGYAVTSRRDPADGLIHVRLGPFSGPDQANKWRQKLMNDGYNAIVQQ